MSSIVNLELDHSNNNKRKRSPAIQMKQNDQSRSTTTMNVASALFRNSSTSKKSTRPPMSKLFASLELSPEDFLHLQSAAKLYMLDDAHPERRDTVGIRGKGDNEMVKLRLWNCVKDFLDGQGNGIKFFGADVPNNEGGPRTMIWPQDKKKIISAVIPLLRRVITNERQRQYALETRGKGQTEDKPIYIELDKERTTITTTTTTTTTSHHHHNHDHIAVQPYIPGVVFKEINGCDLNDYNGWKLYENSPRIIKLSIESGSNPTEFNELVATFDYHLRVAHRDYVNVVECSESCQSRVIEKIITSETGIWENGTWRLEGLDVNLCDKSMK
jgi:hypothetical protein